MALRDSLKFQRRMEKMEISQNGFDWFLKAVHIPLTDDASKWNIPYYCYLYQKNHLITFLVTMKEAENVIGIENEWSYIQPILLEMYEGESFEELEEGALPDAYFYDTYLFLKSLISNQSAIKSVR